MNQTGIRAGVRRLFRLPLHTAEIARDDADAELQSFLDERIEYLVLRGMTLEQARAEALRRMGNPLDETRAHLRRSAERRERKLQFRDTLDGVLQDVRFAARGLARRPGFTAIAVLTIAIGIGATTSVYSIVDRVLLRPLPWREPQRIVQVRQTYLKWRGNPQYQRSWNTVPLAMDEFETLRDRTTVFDGVGIWDNRGLILTGRGEAQQVRTTLTSASLLNVLGVHPIRGRGFLPGEDALGGPNIALLGYDAWQRRFGGADDAVGQFVKLDTISYQIVGILPPRWDPRTLFCTPSGNFAMPNIPRTEPGEVP